MTTSLKSEELLTAKSHRFYVDGLRYDMGLSPGGKLWFALTGGAPLKLII